jgi:Tol biopolymer transport system component
MGFVYIDDAGTLHRQALDGTDHVIDRDVTEAAVSPTGLRVAFIEGGLNSTEIWGYDVGLQARYRLASDSAPLTSVAWAPAGNRIAYLRRDPTTVALRVRAMTGAAATTTVMTGDIGSPEWLPDSTHLVFAAALPLTGGGVSRKAFVINAVAPPPALSLAAGLPADPNIDVTSPASSPDGHQIAFLSGDQVWLMNADGTRPTELTKQDLGSFPYSCRAPAWTRT